jgi:hypothetical protein
MPLWYAHKYDAYPHELMTHITRTLQPFSRDYYLGSSISLSEDQKLGH